ncbi:MAG: hypothetical protein IH623_15140 [Verrucomicrobia bacterium]|nr:hypothetical protein [Verrucomicrobiota bacterium]
MPQPLNFRRLVNVPTILFTVAVLGLLSFRTWNSLQVRDAKLFCESLIPKLRQELSETGKYPDKIDPAWWAGKKVPPLINTHEMYSIIQLTSPPSNRVFILRFENPYAFWDNIVRFRSDDMAWDSFDANQR